MIIGKTLRISKSASLLTAFVMLFVTLTLNPIAAHAGDNDVTGTVSVTTGSGSVVLQGVTVTATSAAAETADPASSPVETTTNSSGVYTLVLTAHTDWSISFSKTNYTTSTSTNVDSTGGATLDKTLDYTRGIYGRVSQSGTAQSGVTVTVHNATTGAVVATTTNNSTGYYVFAGLATGSYKLEFAKAPNETQWFKGDGYSFSFATASSVSVTSSSKTQVNMGQLSSPGTPISPSPTPTPSVSGTPTVGSTLNASSGSSWGSGVELNYQWQRSTTNAFEDANTTDIEGAILSSYNLQSDDFDHYLRVKITGRKFDYANYVRTSAGTAQIAMQSQVPTISGTLTVGEVLTASTGTWSPTPSFSYQWVRNSANIASATSSTYTLVTADAGATISVIVTGTNGDKVVRKTSAATAAVGKLISVAPVPTITGTAAVGKVLTAKTGAWTPSSVTFAYQWYRNSTAIVGATLSTYTLVAADLNNYITVSVTASLASYTSVTKTSDSTSAVLDRFTTIPTPAITGLTAVGSVLTVDPGTWAPSGATFAYQWLRNSIAISGATGTTYTLVAADDLTNITVRVTASKSGYADETMTSAVYAIGKQFTNHNAPTLKGNNWIGQTITATIGLWDTNATLTHQWYRNDVAIPGATAHKYKLTAADVGKKITLATTGRATGYITKISTSLPTKVILNGKPFTKAPIPTITGTLKVGKVLTAKAGIWYPVATKVTYQWLRNLVPITGATAKTYKLTAADLGTSIRVRVVATKAGYATTAKASRPSAAIK